MKKPFIPQAEEIPYLKTILFIASADETLTDEEMKFFSAEGTKVGLSKEEIDSAINWVKVKKEPLENIAKGIKSEETKSFIVSRLLELCFSDGEYSVPEKNGMIDICILLDFELEKLRKLEGKAEKEHRAKTNALKIKAAGDETLSKLSKVFDVGKEETGKLGKKIADGSTSFAHSIASGLGVVGSKISLTFENAKKAKEENKELREKLKKDSLTEAVKQRVIVQLHTKIQALVVQLKEEKKRNDKNEEMIRLLQEQIADLEMTVTVAESAKTA